MNWTSLENISKLFISVLSCSFPLTFLPGARGRFHSETLIRDQWSDNTQHNTSLLPPSGRKYFYFENIFRLIQWMLSNLYSGWTGLLTTRTLLDWLPAPETEILISEIRPTFLRKLTKTTTRALAYTDWSNILSQSQSELSGEGWAFCETWRGIWWSERETERQRDREREGKVREVTHYTTNNSKLLQWLYCLLNTDN